MLKFLSKKEVFQIAFVVEDIEKSKQQIAAMFGIEHIPETGDLGDPARIETRYMGKAAPQIECQVVHFPFDNIDVEIMSPNKTTNAWRDFMDIHGEGVHHISFFVDDFAAAIQGCREKGMTPVQTGKFAGLPGAYCFLDTNGILPCYIELMNKTYEGNFEEIRYERI